MLVILNFNISIETVCRVEAIIGCFLHDCDHCVSIYAGRLETLLTEVTCFSLPSQSC